MDEQQYSLELSAQQISDLHNIVLTYLQNIENRECLETAKHVLEATRRERWLRVQVIVEKFCFCLNSLYAAHEDEAIARQEEGNDDAEYWHGVADAFSAAGFLMWQECDDAE